MSLMDGADSAAVVAAVVAADAAVAVEVGDQEVVHARAVVDGRVAARDRLRALRLDPAPGTWVDHVQVPRDRTSRALLRRALLRRARHRRKSPVPAAGSSRPATAPRCRVRDPTWEAEISLVLVRRVAPAGVCPISDVHQLVPVAPAGLPEGRISAAAPDPVGLVPESAIVLAEPIPESAIVLAESIQELRIDPVEPGHRPATSVTSSAFNGPFRPAHFRRDQVRELQTDLAESVVLAIDLESIIDQAESVVLAIDLESTIDLAESVVLAIDLESIIDQAESVVLAIDRESIIDLAASVVLATTTTFTIVPAGRTSIMIDSISLTTTGGTRLARAPVARDWEIGHRIIRSD